MIRLHSDFLVFELESGETIPCSVEAIACELVEAVSGLTDKSIIENAARAVVHYFREDQSQEIVSIQEFIDCLAFVLRGFGFEVETVTEGKTTKPAAGVATARTSLVDFVESRREDGTIMEMDFFLKLRDHLKSHLQENPDLLLFTGVRPCVQRILSSNRWNRRCEALREQLVLFLEECLTRDGSGRCHRMVIR